MEENDESTDKMYNFDVFINGNLEPGIAFDVQIINDELYHPHINIHENIRGFNLTYKLFIKFIYEFGLIYASKGRIVNSKEVPAIFTKLAQDPKIEMFETKIEGGTMFLFKDHPEYDYYINKYRKGE